MDWVLLLRLVAAVCLTASIGVEVARHVDGSADLVDQGDELVASPEAGPSEPGR